MRVSPVRLSEPEDDVEFVERQPDWASVRVLGGANEMRVENKSWIDSLLGQVGSLLGGGPYERDRGDQS